MLAIGIKTNYSPSFKEEVYINPTNHIIQKNDKLFVIADSSSTADQISFF